LQYSLQEASPETSGYTLIRKTQTKFLSTRLLCQKALK